MFPSGGSYHKKFSTYKIQLFQVIQKNDESFSNYSTVKHWSLSADVSLSFRVLLLCLICKKKKKKKKNTIFLNVFGLPSVKEQNELRDLPEPHSEVIKTSKMELFVKTLTSESR